MLLERSRGKGDEMGAQLMCRDGASPSRSVGKPGRGVLETVELTSVKYILVLVFSMLISSEAEPSHHEPSKAHASTNLSQPVSLPSSHRPHGKHFSPPDEALTVRTSPLPPHYGSLPTFDRNSSNLPILVKQSTSRKININLAANSRAPPYYLRPESDDSTSYLAQPPSSPVSGCCKPGSIRRRDSGDCQCVYPIKIVLLLMNISLSTQPLKYSHQSGRSELLKELAYQLGLQEQQIELIEFCQARLSQLNITLDIVPLNGISFSATDAYTMNSSLAMHKVYIDPKLVGDYKLLSFIWFKPPPPSAANQRTHEDAASPIGSLRHPSISSTWLLTYEELKEATKDFEPASVIGQGGSGKVFKGVLSDGTPVAVKKLTSGRHHGEKEFLVEVEMLSRVFHRNLVKLLGYCSSRDPPEKLLCYELVPNGSLEAWLHAPEYAMTGRLLVKSDVYSFGVVLLELLTGRKPVDMSQPFGKENLRNFDPKLGGKYPKEDFVNVCTIAAACVALEPKQRPMMGEVVQSLKMVQRGMEYQDFMVTDIRHHPSTKYESDGASSSNNVIGNVSQEVVVFSDDIGDEGRQNLGSPLKQHFDFKKESTHEY
ncbi:receptor-like serine/threonine-protein kinase isoform X3 [Cinnamomum micranthum f. kanehirae]|uniref:Receptor-like serine/threonine-protein kinase isoform X3 n=1 Tax=Cinnamomum micranthum f. kanehirae TaxID=337451 RepID=A0A443PWR2_9MAGN|nr:receptor-like serine/threonine-protein kinase isoform X3 [Cinnamomum micranthum f. kanehirae]